ncbi:M66 family metalloprotease [Acidovorax sp. FHTAMBA]|uniref:M66 family metalloprotease n=1 Tax=Acidovorax sp. FHTAMBA TaxID=3140252 RepID=UPI001C70B21B
MRNDLGGTFPAMVQFAQSHTVDPSGNEARQMPRLTAQREALLMITPDASLGEVDGVKVMVVLNGQSKGTLTLRHPNEIPRSDYVSNARADYVYSRRAWSVALPWDWVQPGMELRVTDSRGRTGTLAASAIDFAAPAELVVHSVRLGMLTDPPVNNSGGHWFRTNPAEAATDYLQTIPAARITAAYYEDVKLTRVMVASGVIYDTASAVNGDVYSGDMRENTAKSTFSVGINLANWGVTSSGMQSQQQPQVTQSVVIHHARGVYANGVQNHGLSGGNSILTLSTSRGNEFSHEIGHHYGLGHYPGQNGNDYFWAGHHHDSGWGYIGYRKRMRANIHWTRGKNDGLSGMPVLDDTYSFNTDSMAGGHYASSLSQYAHYTGYSTRNRIQPSLDKPVPAPATATGYVKWNADTRTMEPVAPSVPNQNTVWFNSANGKFLAPRLHGVPVITLLGGYDPETGSALIYPALRGNWGNVFNLPATAASAGEPRECWLTVAFASGAQQRIALAGKRMQAGLVNKLHVNLAQSELPSQAKLQCQAPGQPAQQLYTLEIPQNLPAMPAPVVVGKEAGYSALRQAELPQLDTALQGLAGKNVLALSGNAQLLFESWGDSPVGLAGAADVQRVRYAQQQEQALRLNRWISTYAGALDAGVPEAQSALRSFVRTLGLDDGKPIVPTGQTITMPGGQCIQKVGDSVRIAAKALCSGGVEEQWVLDGRGSIRSRAELELCLTDQGGSNPVRLTACDLRRDEQVWDVSVPKRIARGNRCMDLNTGRLTNDLGTLITYNCTGGVNQQWSGLVMSDSLALALASGANVIRLEKAVTAAR